MNGGRVVGLAGVILWTARERFEPMAAFYQEVLGLVPRSRRPGFVNFAWGTARLTVAVHGGVNGGSTDPLRVMVNLAVEGIDDLHRRLVTRGVPCLRPPEPEPWGGRVATYADPDGNTVQLLELP